MNLDSPVRRLTTWISTAGHSSTNRPFLRWAYATAVHAELTVAQTLALWRRGSLTSPVPADPGNVTLAVKTFERPDVLRRMLTGVRRVYAGAIVVVDDGTNPFRSDDPLVTVIGMPFDSGLGAGRNRLIDAIQTEYIWIADDDMILLPDFDAGKPVAYLNRHPEIDLYAGRVINLPQWRSPHYPATTLFRYSGQPRYTHGMIIDGLPVQYKVPEFYVARTAELRRVRYDPRLKRVVHNDFFTRAYGRLACVYDADWVGLHVHSMFDPHYQSFRMDQADDFKHLAEKWFSRDAGAKERIQPPRPLPSPESTDDSDGNEAADRRQVDPPYRRI